MNSSMQHPNVVRTSRSRSRGRCGVLAAAAVTSLLAALPSGVSAAIPSTTQSALTRAGVPGASEGLASPYGEVGRFGGFDASGSELGKFVAPVGFAVDPSDPSTSDHNAVYVLDRTNSKLEEGELQYRLQKLSSSGAVLGSFVLPLQTITDTANFTDGHPMISLAVDPAEQRVYALVEGIVSDGLGDEVPVAQRLVAWSTVPTAGKLVKAPGFATEDPLTKAALVAGESVLQPASASDDLYAPEGITVDPANHDVVIEAQQGVISGLGGPTILQRVGTEGLAKEKLDGAPWIANTTIAPEQQQADGIFTTTTGSFGIDLYEQWGRISRLANVSSNFGAPEASLIAPDSSGGSNTDQAASIDNPVTINENSNFGGQSGAADYLTSAAGSPITQLTNGFYAARFAQAGSGVIDSQSLVSPWEGASYFWSQGNAPGKRIGNVGVRLFTAAGTVVTTIGGQAQGQPCNLDYAGLAVATGANGSLFVLTQPNASNGNSDDQVIEFKPGGAGACPQPSGSLTVDGKAGTSFSFPVGSEVTFADSVERKGEAPYRFDWVLLNSATLSVEDLKTQIEAPSYTWPAPSTSHTFTKKGTYYAAATVYGDYGLTYITTVKITIH